MHPSLGLVVMTTNHAPAEPTDCNDCSEGPKRPRNVRLAAGEFVWQQEDLRIAGRGLDFIWTRTYRSLPESPDRHWDHAYALRAEATLGGIQLWTGIGGADLPRPDARGTYAARGVFAGGRLDSGNQFRCGSPAGGYGSSVPLDGRGPGYIARIIDRNGNALRFGYDEAGRLEVITDRLAATYTSATTARAGSPPSPTSPAADCPTATPNTAISGR